MHARERGPFPVEKDAERRTEITATSSSSPLRVDARFLCRRSSARFLFAETRALASLAKDRRASPRYRAKCLRFCESKEGSNIYIYERNSVPNRFEDRLKINRNCIAEP